MILVIKTNQHRLHDDEFVKPITDLLPKNQFIVKHYSELTEENIEKTDKIIICGTALKDNNYRNNLDKFVWLKTYNKPVLGICAGMQIIGLMQGHKLINNKKIGVFEGKYHLHNFGVKDFRDEMKIDNFRGYLFHPEVLNKNLILEFART